MIRSANSTKATDHLIGRFAFVISEFSALVVAQHDLPSASRDLVVWQERDLPTTLRRIDDECGYGESRSMSPQRLHHGKAGFDRRPKMAQAFRQVAVV